MTQLYQQGDADGLCGLYCVLNFLNLHDQDNWENEPGQHDGGMRYIFDVCAEFGWLNPYQLAWGYEAYQLVEILRKLNDRWGLQIKVHNTVDLTPELRNRKTFEKELLIGLGGFFINGHSNHWTLIHASSPDGEIIVYDSLSRQKRPEPLASKNAVKISLEDPGVVIWRDKSPTLVGEF